MEILACTIIGINIKNNKYLFKKRKIQIVCFFIIKIILLTILIFFYFIFNFINKTKESEYYKHNENYNCYEDYKHNEDDKCKEDDKNCYELDPINLFEKRLKNKPEAICKNGNSEHICYINNKGYYNNIFSHKNGVICTMKNIILDPSKSSQSGYTYKGPVDFQNLGFPILSKGFFNMKCNNPEKLKNTNKNYDRYFNSWNYEYNYENEKIEELSPGKTIFFISRNQDSPNLFHGNSEIVNAISMMYLFNLKPENIQVIFLESMTINNDPFYDIYKNIISRGGEPIYIKNLKNKYLISSGIHIPLNWDSPCYLKLEFPKCKYPSKTYKIYNNLVDKYMNISKFTDSFISDNETFYYPKSIIDNHELKMNFNKVVTIQWRKIWPKGRLNQYRLLGNAKELANKLASFLPKNFLIRLVDTASLPMKEQITIMRNTDYLVGIHGAGLSLSIFMPYKSIFHEILPKQIMKVLRVMSAVSGQITYSDIIKSETKIIDSNEYIFFNANDFCNKVLEHLKETNLI